MNIEIQNLIEKYTIEIQDLFIELRKLVNQSISCEIEEKLWAKLPSYYVGDKFIRIIPFKDHINIVATAIIEYKKELDGFKITPKGMLQIYLNQNIPEDVLKTIFQTTLLDTDMSVNENIQSAKQAFEASFLEKDFYEKQTADDSHLKLLIDMIEPSNKNKILDLGTGSGYIAFPLAQKYKTSTIVGLDIVTETLIRNTKRAEKHGLNNLQFVSYDGNTVPFSDNSFDIIIVRYALHHFPNIIQSFEDMFRILKPNGKLILSDPTPNENDSCQFVDKFMQIKPDGHIKFYRLDEYQEMLNNAGFQFESNQVTTIRFPRKEAEKYSDLIKETDSGILSGYQIEVTGDEIWITEQVLNMIFIKR